MTTTVGEWIRRTRESLGWSQDELSYESHVSVRLIGRYERGEGRPNQKTLDKLLIALRQPPPWENPTGSSEQATPEKLTRLDWPMPAGTSALAAAGG